MESLCVFAAALTLAASGYARPDIKYVDGTDTFVGPARGYAPGGWKVFQPEGLPKWRGAKSYNSSLWELSRFSGGRVQGKHAVPTNRVGGADIPLTVAMKSDVRRYLEETRRNGGSLIVRLGYTWSDRPGCEPGDFDIVLGHVRELSRIMADYDDVVVGVEAGIAGPWAEMHSSDYCRKEYMDRILKTYCDNLSPDISILVRTAHYIASYAGTKSDGLLAMLPFRDAELRRFGMFNDGYLGTWWDYGTWSGEWKREKGCRLLNACGDHPYGGELAYVGRDWLDKNRERCADLLDAAKWNIVKDWYETHLNYLRNAGDRRHPLCAFIAERKFEVEKYRFEGMPDLHEYEGVDLHKFMLDHMGWRFVVRDARLPETLAPGKDARIALAVENTGFGKLLLPSRAEVVFASQSATNTVGVAFRDGDFSSIEGGRRKNIAMKFTVPEGLKPGKYDVLLRVSAPLKDEKPGEIPRRPVRFANEGMWNEELKANILGCVETGSVVKCDATGASVPQLEAKIRGMMDENMTAGMSVVVVKGDKVVYQQAFGYRDKDTREPLDVNDIFRIASISKSFSGMSVMQLVEAGKMSLDDDVNDILGMDIRNPRYPDVPVTVRMLLSHTSGMCDGGGYHDLAYVDKTKTDINLIREKAWLSYPPGKGYRYCNRALNIIGLVIEKVSGERFDEYVLNHILKPIGADNSGFNLDKLDAATITKLYQYSSKRNRLVPGGGYKRINEKKVADGTYVIGKDGFFWSPTGGMKMSAPNLAKWMTTLKNGGVAPNGNRIISEKGCRTMLTPVIDTSDPGVQYCLTTRVETRFVKGKRLVGHTGSAHGLYSCMYFCPDEDWGIVCICSSAKPDKVNGMHGIRKCLHGVFNLLYDTFARQ